MELVMIEHVAQKYRNGYAIIRVIKKACIQTDLPIGEIGNTRIHIWCFRMDVERNEEVRRKLTYVILIQPRAELV